MDFSILAKSAAEELEKYSVLSDKDLQLMKNLMSYAAVEQHFSAWTSAIKERGFPYSPTSINWYCYGANLEGADLPYPYPLEKQGYIMQMRTD